MLDFSQINSSLNAAVEQAKQTAANGLFDFVGENLTSKAEGAGIELKNQFVPKIEEPEVADGLPSLSFSPQLQTYVFIGAAAIAGLLFFRKKLKAA